MNEDHFHAIRERLRNTSQANKWLEESEVMEIEDDDGYVAIGPVHGDDEYEEASNDVKFIRHAAKDIQSLLNEIDALHGEKHRLRDALKFYGDVKSYAPRVGPDNERWVDIDEGLLARTTLRHLEGK